MFIFYKSESCARVLLQNTFLPGIFYEALDCFLNFKNYNSITINFFFCYQKIVFCLCFFASHGIHMCIPLWIVKYIFCIYISTFFALFCALLSLSTFGYTDPKLYYAISTESPLTTWTKLTCTLLKTDPLQAHQPHYATLCIPRVYYTIYLKRISEITNKK